MFRPMRSVGLLCIALVCLAIPTTPSRAGTAHRVFVPMLIKPLPYEIAVSWSAITLHSTPPSDIYMIAGEVWTQLTNTPDKSEDFPTWSQDRSRIGFVETYSENSTIAILEVAHPMVVNRFVLNGYASDLEWSPADVRLALVLSVDGRREIYSVNVDGTNLRQLTHNLGDAASPTWSPDGTKIAFSLGSHIFVMNADGSALDQLTTLAEHGAVSGGLDWSPDGTRIAYAVFDMYIMAADGSNPKRLTTGTTARAHSPNWSPDNKYICFQRQYSRGSGQMVVEVANPGEYPFKPCGAWAR